MGKIEKKQEFGLKRSRSRGDFLPAYQPLRAAVEIAKSKSAALQNPVLKRYRTYRRPWNCPSEVAVLSDQSDDEEDGYPSDASGENCAVDDDTDSQFVDYIHDEIASLIFNRLWQTRAQISQVRAHEK